MRRTIGGILALVLAAAWCPCATGAVGWGTIEEPPEVVHARLKEKAEQEYKDGMEALAKGDTSRAVRFFLRVAKARIDSRYPAKAFEELKKIKAQGDKELDVARQFVAGEDVEAGVLELTRIMRVYSGLAPAKVAGGLLTQLKQDPKFQQALVAGKAADDLEKARDLEKQAEAIAKGEELKDPGPAPEDESGDPAKNPPAKETPKPTPARTKEPPKPMTPQERKAASLEPLSQAYEIYRRVAAQCPDTKPGKEAAEAVARIEKAEAGFLERKKQADAQREAKQWLGLAEAYFKAGRFDLARDFCQKILQAHPDVPQAAEAKALVERMRK